MATITHLILLKEEFTSAAKLPDGITVRNAVPTYSNFMKRITKIGDDWHLRSELRNPSRELYAAVEDGELYVFDKNGMEIGFCYVSFEGQEIRQTGISGSVEINKVGLYPGNTGNGLGRPLIDHVLSNLFQMGASAVCLNTRDSNHVNSIPFYKRIGFHATKNEPVGEKEMVPTPL